MKSKVVVLVIVILFQHSFASGQTFAMAAEMNQSKIKVYSTTNIYDSGQNRKMYVSTISDKITMAVGLIVFLDGVFISSGGGLLQDGGFGGPLVTDAQKRNGNNVMIVGGIIFLGGTALLINGIVLGHSHNRRYGVAAPKSNEIGLAYNF